MKSYDFGRRSRAQWVEQFFNRDWSYREAGIFLNASRNMRPANVEMVRLVEYNRAACAKRKALAKAEAQEL